MYEPWRNEGDAAQSFMTPFVAFPTRTFFESVDVDFANQIDMPGCGRAA